MSLKQIAKAEGVVQLSPESSVKDACRLMEERNVGCIVVTQHGRPVGILTDRDVILRAVNRGLDLQKTKVGEIMSRNVVHFSEYMPVDRAMELIADQSPPGRRFPLVDGDGIVTGIVTVDDIIRHAGKEMHAVGRIIERESA